MFYLLIISLFLFIYFYNSLIAKKNQVDSISSSVDVELRKRYNLIPNLVSTVSKYMKHENDLLKEITKLRVQAIKNDISEDELKSIDKNMTKTLGSIMVAVENYPELKSNENMIQLQQTISDVESNIAAVRRSYNQAVMDYNSSLDMIPTNFIAKFLNYNPKEFFEIENNQRKNINVAELFAA